MFANTGPFPAIVPCIISVVTSVPNRNKRLELGRLEHCSLPIRRRGGMARVDEKPSAHMVGPVHRRPKPGDVEHITVVTKDTPRHLWLRYEGESFQKKYTDTRVPESRVGSLTWEMSPACVFQSGAN